MKGKRPKIYDKIHRASFQRKLVLYMFLVILITIISLSVFNYAISSGFIRKQVKEHTDEQLIKSTEFISAYIAKLKKTSTILSEHFLVHDFIKGKYDANRINHMFDLLTTSDSNLDSILIVTKDGRVVSNKSILSMKTSTNMMKEEWYINAIKHKNIPSVTIAVNANEDDEETKRVISVSQEIVDEHGNNLAVMRIDINYNIIDSYLSKLDLGKSGYAFIIDDQNNIIYHPDPTLNSKQMQEDINYIKDDIRGFIKDKDIYVAKASIANSKWKIVTLASLERVEYYNKNLMYFSIIIFTIIAIVSFITITLLLKIWLRPLKTLRMTMLEVENGNLTVRADEDGSREFNDLSRNFNTMLINIDGLMKLINKQQEEMRKYELQALASQINPHFLYNTLDTVIWMAEFNDNKSVVSIVKSLAKFFRLSLNSGNDIISLKDEIDHIRQYLYIQKQRYADELEYEIIEDERFDDFQLPKLVLQPIVENAIYHGIKGLSRQGIIKVTTKSDNDNLIITIYDNGHGINSNMKEKNKATRLGGVGLSNVGNRLKLYFNENFKMNINSKVDEYTEIELIFKLNELNENN